MKKEKCHGATIYCGEALRVLKRLKSGSVQCIVTSPPYFALRSYLSDDSKDKALEVGTEETPELYIKRLVRIFREARRVLRNDGTLWVNIADSYASSGRGGDPSESTPRKQATNRGSLVRGSQPSPGFKPKDRIGIPHMLAFALRADGWYWRDEIVWAAPNKMPESTVDRCTKSHEFIFMFSKSRQYFYDQIAIREKSSEASGFAKQRSKGVDTWKYNGTPKRQHVTGQSIESSTFGTLGYRNKRSVWAVSVASEREAHFAAYPPKLIRPCIRAGVSKYGACGLCGAPYKRLLVKQRVATRPGTDSKVHKVKTAGRNSRIYQDRDPAHSSDRKIKRELSEKNAYRPATDMQSDKTSLAPIVGNRDPQRHISSSKTVGWEPTCSCGSTGKNGEFVLPPIKKCVVLDPFAGTATTGVVALENNCRAILIELNPEYIPIMRKKLKKAAGRRGFGL